VSLIPNFNKKIGVYVPPILDSPWVPKEKKLISAHFDAYYLINEKYPKVQIW
jgi:hypothetical protein